MARSSSGKSVARAAATGGGATYRGQMPVNWYAALVVIVLVGLASVAFAKFHYNQTAAAVEPTVTTTWHAGLAVDICGKMQEALPASPSSSTSGLTTTGQGVLSIAPKTSSEAGANATLGKFASEYTGFTLTNTSLKYPVGKATLYTNGEKCPTGTPDAGKVADVKARSWVLSTKTVKSGQEQTETGGTTTLKPASLRFDDRQLITLGFVPAGTQLPKPPGSTILGLVQVLNGEQPVATTTTTLPVTSTTAPSSSTTSTTAGTATSTTAAPTSTTTTTSSATSTSTTKPPSTTTTTK
jgi:hypothetical protein